MALRFAPDIASRFHRPPPASQYGAMAICVLFALFGRVLSDAVELLGAKQTEQAEAGIGLSSRGPLRPRPPPPPDSPQP